jgi:hypothetical protein
LLFYPLLLILLPTRMRQLPFRRSSILDNCRNKSST